VSVIVPSLRHVLLKLLSFDFDQLILQSLKRGHAPHRFGGVVDQRLRVLRSGGSARCRDRNKNQNPNAGEKFAHRKPPGKNGNSQKARVMQQKNRIGDQLGP